MPCCGLEKGHARAERRSFVGDVERGLRDDPQAEDADLAGKCEHRDRHAAMKMKDAASPSASQPAVVGARVGRLGTTARPAASMRFRTSTLAPIRDRAPKQPHGGPLRPLTIAMPIAAAKSAEYGCGRVGSDD